MTYFVALLLALLAPAAYASNAGAEGFAFHLMCQTYAVAAGPLALMAGFCVAVYGLYLMITTGTYRAGIILVVLGALLTAVPGLIIGGLKGTSTLLKQAGVTQTTTDLGTVLDSLRDYAEVKGCNTILIDFSVYNSTRPEGYDVQGSYNTRGSGASGTGDSSSYPEIDTSLEGAQLPCFGQVLDLAHVSNPRLSSPYGYRVHPITHERQKMHHGMDIAVPKGTPILAFKAGKVTASNYSSTAGNMVVIDHGSGFVTKYFHMSDRNARVGQQVTAGTVIGWVGSTPSGGSTGNHLHFQVEQGGNSTNPMPILGCGGA